MDTPSLPLQLEELFFPVQWVQANPDHDPNGNRRGTAVSISPLQVQRVDSGESKFIAELIIESNAEQSDNPPYSFTLHVYAVVNLTTDSIDMASAQAVITTTCLMLLIGAARERLAELTSRAPWGRFFIDVMPVSMPMPAPAVPTPPQTK
jgi:hypothetical protein